MTDQTPQPAAPQPPLVLRSWPKIILMLPTFFVAVACGIIMMFQELPTGSAEIGSIRYVGLAFLFVLAVNLTVLLYDLNLRGFMVVVLLIIALVLCLAFLNTRLQGRVWSEIGRVLSVGVVANSAFYFLFAIVLLLNLAIAWVITRFNYWQVEHNEIIVHNGFMHEQERHPTAQARFKLVIDDIVEYGILGCGKLVFHFGDDETQHVLETVLFVHKKAKRLDALLGRIAVVSATGTTSS